MEATKLRVGVIGTGIFAMRAHLPVLQSLADLFEIVACANRSEEKALAYASAAGVPKDRVFTDYRQLLELADVDVVVVALPVEFNFEVSQAALAKGKHVLMEKPIAHTLESAGQVKALAADFPDQVLMIAENYPYKESINAASTLISSGVLGDVVTFNLIVSRQFDPSTNAYLGTAWRQKPHHVGGFLSDGGVHWASLLTSTLGPVASVSAFSRQIEALNGTDDTIALSLKLKSGAIGNFTLTFAAGGAGFATFTVVGRKATLVLQDCNTLTVINAKGEAISKQTFDDNSGPATTAKRDILEEFKDFHATVVARRKTQGGEGLHEELSDFVVVHKTQPKVSVHEAYHHFAIIASALQSMETKQMVDIP